MRSVRGERRVIALALLVFGVFAVLMLVRPGSDDAMRTVSYAVRTLTGVAALAAMWHRGRRGDADLRRPRLLIAAALLCGSLSGIIATLYQVVGGAAPPVPSLADAAYFLLLPLAVLGLLSYPVKDLSQGSRSRSLLEGLIAALGLWFVTYTLLLAPAGVGEGLPLLAALTVLGYPVSDVLLIAIAMSVLSRVRDEARREVLLTAGGMGLLAVSDVAYSVLQARGAYRADSWVAVLGELGLLLIVVAAVTRRDAAPGADLRFAGALPYLPVLLVVAVVAADAAGTVEIPTAAVPGAIGLVLALMLRQAVTERDNTRLLDRLAEREELFRSLVTASSDLISLHDQDGRVRYVSPAAARTLGRSEAELTGRHLMEYAHPDDVEAAGPDLAEVLRTPGASSVYSLRVRAADGEWRWMETVAHNLVDNPSVRGVVCNTRDVHERVLLERRLSHAAFHDALTGLPNRLALTERVEAALADGSHGALLWLDLDGFKEINDALGHKVGDSVLVEVGRRLDDVVRAPDLVGRLGGDELVVFSDAGSQEQALRLAERISTVLREPIDVGGGTHAVSASIGVAMTPAADASSLFAAADVAMYEAKHKARGSVCLFDDRLFEELHERLALTSDLRHAVARGELRLHYQPVVHLATGAVTGVEALVRWEHPERGLLAPGAFIGLAERSGLICEIGTWVIEEACAQLARWQQTQPTGDRLSVAVNLSAAQIADPGLVSLLTSALLRGSTDPSLLTLEVTESSVMEDVTTAISTLDALRQLGLRIAIDDFGTGYSSLTYLKQFPVHEVKMDKSFIDGVGTNADDSAIVAAVVTLARAIDLEVVAEGVEKPRQQALLRTLGCDYGQGYLWHRPVPAHVLEPWLVAHGRGPTGAAPATLRLAVPGEDA